MAACAFDDVEQEFTSSGSRRSSGFSGNPGKTRGLQALELQPGDSEATRKDPVKEGLIKVLPAQEHPAAGDGRKERMGCDRPGPEESRTRRIPAMSTEAGDGAEEEQRVGEKGWLRGVRGSRHDKRPSGDEASSSSSSSSQRGPPTRRGSEDSTLMEAESTASSGRSTPAMITGTRAGSTPTIDPASSSKGSAYPCCWDRCLDSFSSSPDLAEHVRGVHADSQHGGMYVCLWRGCKVYNTPSSNPSWLQRHLLSHSGDKPFKCVVAGCSASFASQGGVARHVASHFSQQNASKPANQHRGKEESPSKGSVRRRRLRSRHRRFLPRPHDFFDAQTMDAIRHRAICLNLATHIESLGHGHSVVFHSTVIARRKEDSGKVKVLLHWTPEDILPDAWVCETDRPQLKTKIVHLSQLPRDTALLLDPKTYRMFL